MFNIINSRNIESLHFGWSEFPGKKLGLTMEPANLKDVTDMLALTQQVAREQYGDEPIPSLEKQKRERFEEAIRYKRQYKGTPNWVYVIRKGKEIVGTAVMTWRYRSGEKPGQWVVQRDEAMLYIIYLLQEYQGRGIGSWLVDHCIALAKRRGAKRMHVIARPITRKILERRGFEVIHGLTFKTPGVVKMERDLQKDNKF